MSLYDEMLEQNSRYQATMQENEELKEQIATLEQLLSEYEKLIEGIPGHGSRESLAWEIQRMELQQRAHATLQQE